MAWIAARVTSGGDILGVYKRSDELELRIVNSEEDSDGITFGIEDIRLLIDLLQRAEAELGNTEGGSAG